MNSRRFISSALLALTACVPLLSRAASGPESRQAASDAGATVPYVVLYKTLEPGLTIAKHAKLRATQRILSRVPEVTPSQIKVEILSTRGVIQVPIDAMGRAQFPLDAALLSENPMVRSNQPKGSLSVSATMEFNFDNQKTIAYQELVDSVKQAQAAMQELGQAMAASKISTVEFAFDPRAAARVQVNDDKAEDLLLADQFGLVRIRLDERKLKNHAVIVLSAPALAIRPQLD